MLVGKQLALSLRSLRSIAWLGLAAVDYHAEEYAISFALECRTYQSCY